MRIRTGLPCASGAPAYRERRAQWWTQAKARLRELEDAVSKTEVQAQKEVQAALKQASADAAATISARLEEAKRAAAAAEARAVSSPARKGLPWSVHACVALVADAAPPKLQPLPWRGTNVGAIFVPVWPHISAWAAAQADLACPAAACAGNCRARRARWRRRVSCSRRARYLSG